MDEHGLAGGVVEQGEHLLDLALRRGNVERDVDVREPVVLGELLLRGEVGVGDLALGSAEAQEGADAVVADERLEVARLRLAAHAGDRVLLIANPAATRQATR